MSKTSQENKVKKAKVAQEVQDKKLERKADVVDTTVETPEATSEVNNEVEATSEEATTESKARVAKVRGKKYLAAKKKVDVNKNYPLSEAIKLVKETSFAKFEGKIEAHITATETGTLGEIAFPHLDLGAKKIAILNDTVLKEIKAGEISFDILIATPATMPKLLPFAKLLGPKGLMPNPKNGTLTDDPEASQKKLSVAKTQIKTEKKAPVVHLVVAKVSQDEKEIKANVEELISVIGNTKIKKMTLSATMGPGVKVLIEK